jgi:hypothetical protein
MKNEIVFSVLAVVVSIFIVMSIFGIYPGRYRYIESKTDYIGATMVNSDTKETYIEYVPQIVHGVFDSWTGKSYSRGDLLREVVFEEDLIRKRSKAGVIPKGDLTISPAIIKGINFEEYKKEITARSQREKNKQTDDIMKAYLQGNR